MSFRPALQELVLRAQGARGAVFCDGEGESVDLVKSTIPVINTLPASARVTDTWTAHTFNAGDDSDVVKYKIAPRPDVKP